MRENDEEDYEEEVATKSHLSLREGKQETVMEPTITEVITPPEFQNKEELVTDFAPMTE